MKITRKQLEDLIIQETEIRDYNPQDFPEKYDAEEVERFPSTAPSKDEMLHADIVSSVYDAIADTALLNAGKDRENIVLTGIDNELESREMEGEEVDMTQIDLKSIFRDVMIDLAAVEKSKGMTESKQEGKMKITREQLRRLIKEELSLLSEQASPAELYDRLVYLRNEHQGEFELLARVGEDGFREVIQARDEILADPNLEGYEGYKAFFRRVKQQYNLFPETVRNLYDERYGGTDVEELKMLKAEYDDLYGQFRAESGTTAADSRYGRRRTQVVHTPTGEVVNTGVNRKGSLGT